MLLLISDFPADRMDVSFDIIDKQQKDMLYSAALFKLSLLPPQLRWQYSFHMRQPRETKIHMRQPRNIAPHRFAGGCSCLAEQHEYRGSTTGAIYGG